MSTPQKIPFEKIQSITNNFSKEKLIGEGFLGKNYKGQLSQSGQLIDVAVRRLDRSLCVQEVAYEKEIEVLSKLEHENIVSNIGFCYDNNELIIVNKHEPRGSLRNHLSGSNLTWMQRLRISVGVASALSYLHNGGRHNYSVIHHNVNSSSILLDEKWEPKLSGFEYSMTRPAGRNLVLAYEQPGFGNYKADVFSFGIVLLQILCGEKSFTADDGSFQAASAIFLYESRKLHKMVDPDLFSQMDPQSFNIFSETAYLCLKEQGAPPFMNQVFKRLERALKLQEIRENPERLPVPVKRTLSPDLKLMLKKLEHMRLQLYHIVLATNNFDSIHCIASGGFCTVYKAELDHVEREHCCAKEEDTVNELPKRRSEVAIKRIFITGDESGEQGFYTEIEMLTKCKHSNILNLLGFCDEGSYMILIYEYATNGSLADYIQNKSNITNDSWTQRMKICLDAANGLSCLHTSEGDRQEIVHRDIKSDNILLGKNFDAKIGDFGLSKFLSINKEKNTIAGTRVYMDPQYVQDAKLKKELDVYSFGLVLFEVLCGKLAYDPVYSSKYNKGLALLAQQHVDDGTVMDILDPKIKEETTKTGFSSIEGPTQDSVDAFSKIAYRCLHERQVNRPTMKVVIEELEKAILLQTMDVTMKNNHDLLSKIATNNGHGENSPYFDGWKAYDTNPFHLQHNPTGVIQMGLAENQLSFDLIQEWIKANPIASICTPQGAFDFKETAIFQDYHGLPEFRTAIANFMSQVRGNLVKFDPNRIVMSGGAAGAAGAHETLAFCLANPGEAFLVPTPYYPGFDRDLRWRTGVELLPVVCESSNNFKITQEALETAYEKAKLDNIKVKGLLITNPSNPLGTHFDKQTLKDLVSFINDKNIHLICDEIYAGTVTAGDEFVSIAEILEEEPECNRDLIHIVYSLSKDMGLPGFRVGIVYSYNDNVVNITRKMSSFGLVSTQTQHMLASMLSDNNFVDNFISESRVRLAHRHDMFTRGLAQVGIGSLESKAGLFFWMDLRRFLKEPTFESEMMVWRIIINEIKLNFSPGQSFHCSEPGWFRVCFANMDDETTIIALRKIKTFVLKNKMLEIKIKKQRWQNQHLRLSSRMIDDILTPHRVSPHSPLAWMQRRI